MSVDASEVFELYVNHFNKIKLLNDMANQIAYYGVNCGNANLFDYIDLNCGAIPDGDFQQVIDVSAPEQFLSLYLQIAENRFAFAVTELLKMNEGYKAPIVDYINRVGQEMKIQGIENAQQAFSVYQAFVLDGMPSDKTKNIIENTPEKITWEKAIDTHEGSWKKAGGNLSVYYEIQEIFVNALFSQCNIIYQITDASKFTLMLNK